MSMIHTATSRRSVVIAALLVVHCSARSRADEHVLLAPKELHYQASGNSPWQKWFPNTLGKNWLKPVNYVNGLMHMRCLAREVTRPTELQVCIYWDGKKGKHSCARSRVRLEQTGDFIAVSSEPAGWWGSEPQNWSNIGPTFRILMRDGLALSKIKDWKTYFPLKVNCTVVMVSQGAVFSGWSNYSFPGMPSTPPTGPADAGTDLPSDDGGLDAPAIHLDWSAPPADEGPAVDSAPTPDSGVTTDADVSAGGGCSSVPTALAGPWAGMLFVILLVLLRRRRAPGKPSFPGENGDWG